ncbi:MAG: hypothetical protein AABM29_10305 [Actinomycetota bacterium]
MSEHDAFEEEMLFRTLSDEDVERLLQGRAPEADEFAEVAEFTGSLRTLAARPASTEASFMAQLAEAARLGMAETDDEAETAETAVLRPRPRRPRLVPPRFAALARATVLVALVPLLFAGLAAAGVTVPEPARKAFEAVGVELPNQPADDEQGSEAAESATGARSDVDDDSAASGLKASQRKGRGKAAARRRHGTAKGNPVRSNPRSKGTQGRGYALGNQGLAPGQIQPPGHLHAPGKLQQSGHGAVGHSSGTTPGQRFKPSAPRGRAKPAAKGGSGGAKGAKRGKD